MRRRRRRRSSEFGRGQHDQIPVSARGHGPVGVRFSDGAGREELCARILLAHEGVEYPEVTPERRRVVSLGAPPIDASVGSLKYSAAAIVPPCALVKASQRRAWSGRHTSSGPRVPSPFGSEVTMGASTAREKSIAPNHCWRVSTPP